MYGWIADACDESSHVVTASRRLARVLTAAYVESQLSAGRTAWSTPSIRSLPDWLRRLAASAPHARQATWIGAQQSRVLWQQVIRQEINDPFVNVSALAWHAREAWKRLHDWRVPFDEFLASSVGQDQRIFARVASVYRQRLIERHWIDDASAGQFLLQCLEEGNLRLPARITLAGFDRLTPLMEAVLEGASSRGASVSEAPHAPPADTCTFSYANPDAELRGAGAWARATLQSEPTASVAIVVSNLEQDSGRAAQLIREGFVPGWQYARGEPASSVNVSYGRRLSEFPAIQVALLLLSWLHRDLRGGDISILLRTPFLGESAGGGRARMELRLRAIPDRPWSPASLLDALRKRDDTPDATDWLGRLSRFASARAAHQPAASPSDWAQLFEKLLEDFGWPGAAALDSRDFQLVNRWRELLNDLTRLAAVSPSMTLTNAVTELALIAADTIFQPEKEHASLQVLGPLEAAGMHFDHLWVSGLTSEQWPPAGRPLALVSRSLQRDYGMPDAEPLDTGAYAQRVLERLARSARHCVFSHALYESDAELSPAAFTETLAAGERVADPGWHASNLAVPGNTAVQSSDPVPRMHSGESISGGAGTIQRQITEPFAAFAYGRLGVSRLLSLETGLSPMLRGNLLHAAAFRLLGDGPSARDLLEWQSRDLDDRIERATAAAMRPYRRGADPVLDALLELESERLQALLRQLVMFDLQRQPFTVDAVEASLDIELAGLTFAVRVDRIDRYADGSLAILDYKTGARRRFIDSAGAPLDVQLVVYAAAVEGPLAELGLYNIDSRMTGIDGAGRDSMGEEAWQAWLDEWRARVRRAAEEIASGDVRIRRWQNVGDARALNLLSRYGELRRDE